MRVLSNAEMSLVAGGEDTVEEVKVVAKKDDPSRYPTYAQKYLGNHIGPPMSLAQKLLDVGIGYIEGLGGQEMYLTTEEREQALSTMYSPSDVKAGVKDGVYVGYVNDGKTILFDLDGDMKYDGAATLDLQGHVNIFDAGGWHADPEGTTYLRLQ